VFNADTTAAGFSDCILRANDEHTRIACDVTVRRLRSGERRGRGHAPSTNPGPALTQSASAQHALAMCASTGGTDDSPDTCVSSASAPKPTRRGSKPT